MQITAAMVKALRDKTGLPMMDCKKALTEAGGDEDKAIEWLRKAGLGRIQKMAARETAEGRIACHVDPRRQCAGIVELRCESAPVSGTEDFVNLANLAARQAAESEVADPQQLLEQPLADDPSRKLSDAMHDVFNRIRENMKLARAARLTGHVGQYVHHNAQVGVLVEMSEECPDQLKADVCMHIAALKPGALRREQVDPAEVERERQAVAEEAKGKPENIVEKIVTGKLNRWYSEFVLLEQPFAKDDKKSVARMLMDISPSLTVKRFLRFEVGGA
jgi:elongation factor Ts